MSDLITCRCWTIVLWSWFQTHSSPSDRQASILPKSHRCFLHLPQFPLSFLIIIAMSCFYVVSILDLQSFRQLPGVGGPWTSGWRGSWCGPHRETWVLHLPFPSTYPLPTNRFCSCCSTTLVSLLPPGPWLNSSYLLIWTQLWPQGNGVTSTVQFSLPIWSPWTLPQKSDWHCDSPPPPHSLWLLLSVHLDAGPDRWCLP